MGIEVDSLEGGRSVSVEHTQGRRCWGANSHEVVLEELLQLPLGGRVGEVPDVESPALGSAGDDCLILGSAGGLVALRSGGRLVEGGVCQLGGNALDRCRHGA